MPSSRNVDARNDNNNMKNKEMAILDELLKLEIFSKDEQEE